MHALFRRLLLLAATIEVAPLAAQTSTIFSDDLTSRAKWVYFSATEVRSENGKLVVDDGNHAIAFFNALGGGKQTIGANESLQVSFTLTFSANAALNPNSSTGMRMGLYDSNLAIIPPANTPTTSSAVFQSYDGYLFSWNAAPPSGNNNLTLRYRVPGSTSSTALMSTFGPTYATTDVSPGSQPPLFVFQNAVDYRVTYQISRKNTLLPNTLSFSFSVTGGAIPLGSSFGMTSTVAAPTTYEFNAFAIYALGGTYDFAIDDVLITHTAVPEPSTYAACAGAAVLGLAFWRRRRAAAKTAVA